MSILHCKFWWNTVVFQILVEFIHEYYLRIDLDGNWIRPDPWAGQPRFLYSYFCEFLIAAAIPIFITSSSPGFTKFLAQAAGKRVELKRQGGRRGRNW